MGALGAASGGSWGVLGLQKRCFWSSWASFLLIWTAFGMHRTAKADSLEMYGFTTEKHGFSMPEPPKIAPKSFQNHLRRPSERALASKMRCKAISKAQSMHGSIAKGIPRASEPAKTYQDSRDSDQGRARTLSKALQMVLVLLYIYIGQ